MQGQDYMVDVAKHPNQGAIIFAEWPKMCVALHYHDGIQHISIFQRKLRNRSKNFFYWLTAELPTIKQQNVFYIWTTPANLKIQLKLSMSEIRNYLVANPIN